jgi:hypothetical protein
MAILSINQNINQANAFIQDVENTRNSYYVFLGKSTPWSNDSSPPVANGSVDQLELQTYNDLLYGKLITSSDIYNVIPRNNWTANTVYTPYDQDDPNLYAEEFYVITTNYDVFKCIDNNNGSPSTVMPTLTSTSGTFQTGDGYHWKYMFTVNSAANTKFTTASFIPVTVNTAVQNNAVGGTIDVIKMINGGSNYQVFETGILQEVLSPTTLRLASNSNIQDNYYACSSIYLKSGVNSGQIRQIIASNGVQKTVTVSPSTPFDFYEKFNLSSIVNPINIVTGQLVSQPIDYISYLYSSGYFNVNDTIVQSDTGVSGTVLAANSSVLQINRNNQSLNFSASIPFRSTINDGTLKAGNVSISNAGILSLGVVSFAGSGYTGNATVTITASDSGTGGSVNAHANSTGRIDSLPIANTGNSYFTIPSIAIAAPANTTFNAQTAVHAGVSNNYDSNCIITLSSAQYFIANDVVTYRRASTNTANIGLISGTSYYIQFANATSIALSSTIGGSRVQLSNSVVSETGHALQGSTATGTIYPAGYLVTNAASSSGTQLNDSANGYSNGDFIRVGTSANSNFRRISSVNSSVIIVDSPFKNSVGPTTHFKLQTAADITSITVSQANGYIKDVDLTSLQVNISSLQIPNESYITGEQVVMVDTNNIYQGANAYVTFANTSVIYMSAVQGSWTANLYALGKSSQQKATITSIISEPNVVIENSEGTFVLGQSVYFGSNSASATLTGIIILPTDQTEYLIGPTVSITGDGTNASAIGIVNNQFGSANDIIGVEVISIGSDYTYANVQFIANGQYGSNASAKAIIAPINGHGSDPITELGGSYVSIYKKFDYADDLTYFPNYNSFRKVGILENPQFDNVLIGVDNFDRVNFTLTSTLGTWSNGEVVVQSSTNAAGVVVSGNTTFLQLKNVKGTFTNTAALSGIYGYYSNTSANVVFANTIYFTPGNAPEIVSEFTSNASAIVKTAYSNTSLLLGNVVGQFVYNDTLVDSITNAYATVTSIALSNGARDETTSFGLKFNNTLRLTLSSNTGAFTVGEKVIQSTTNAYGTVISTNNEIDLAITMITPATTFSPGQVITDSTTHANGIVLSANSTYVKLTYANTSMTFGIYNTINNGIGVTANTQAVYSVLLLNGVGGPYAFQGSSTNTIVGQTSGSYGICSNNNLIIPPDLVKNTGKVIYLENITPVQRSIGSTEEVRLVIKF